MALRKQRQQKAGARWILQHDLAARHRIVAGPADRILPFGEGNFLQLAFEITIVVPDRVGVEPTSTEALEQMRLPEIADVVIHTARLAPARHCRNVAGKDREADQAEGEFYGFHQVSVVPIRTGTSIARPPRHVAISGLP